MLLEYVCYFTPAVRCWFGGMLLVCVNDANTFTRLFQSFVSKTTDKVRLTFKWRKNCN